MHLLEFKAPRLFRAKSYPALQSPNIESSLENGEHRHSLDTVPADISPACPPGVIVRWRNPINKIVRNATVDSGEKKNDTAMRSNNGETKYDEKTNDGTKKERGTDREDGAEAMYSSCDEDFPFEEKLQAVQDKTRPRRDQRRSTDSSSTRSYRRPAAPREIVLPELTTRSPSTGSQLRCLFSRWICLFLPTAPIAVALHYGFGYTPTLSQSIATFVLSAIAIPPLTLTLAYTVEELVLRLGKTLGIIVSLVFSNPALLLLGTFALFDDKVDVVKALVCGGIVSNVLLVQGACFFSGGYYRTEQYYRVTIAERNFKTLVLGLGMILLPSIFFSSSPNTKGVIELSHATAVVSLILYLATLVCNIKTQRDLGFSQQVATEVGNRSLALTVHDEERPTLHMEIAVISFICCSLLLGLCSKSLIDSSLRLIETGSISPTFFGFVILPLLASSVGHTVTIAAAVKDKMELAISSITNLSIDIALLVLPLLIVMSWIAQPIGSASNLMTFCFDGFQSLILFGSVLVFNYTIQDGKSDWLQGLFLISAYVLVAVGIWYYDMK